MMGQRHSEATPPPEVELDFLPQITSESEWTKLIHRPLDKTFARTAVVKVIGHLPSAPKHDNLKVYFLNSRKWEFHHDFCREILHHPTAQDLRTFNGLHYTTDERAFILGTVVHYEDQRVFSLELAPRDSLPGPRILQFLQELRGRVFFGEQLLFRPISQRHHDSVVSVKGTLPQLNTDHLFAGVRFQPLTIGTSVGQVRIFKGSQFDDLLQAQTQDHSQEDVDWSTCIIVCEEIPNELPPVAGLVTTALQTPLCHVALLCSNRQTPNMALRDAMDSKHKLQVLNGKWIRLDVSLQDFSIEETTEEAARAFFDERNAQIAALTKDITLEANLEPSSLMELSTLMQLPTKALTEAGRAIGAKAYNLVRLGKFRALKGMPQVWKWEDFLLQHSVAAPYHFYHTHMTTHQTCKTALAAALAAKSGPQTKATLAVLRKAIQEAPVDQSLASTIVDYVLEWEESGVFENCTGIILRSSTNVEDIDNFNGAGLYDSLTLPLEKAKDKDTVANTIRAVWASVWSYRSFSERQLFGLNQQQVQMAILVQPLFASAFVRGNGVAVTAHPFRSDFPGAILNVQRGKLVTDNCGGARPEQILVWKYNFGPVLERISSSSEVKSGEEILSKDDVEAFWPVLHALDKQFVDPEKHIYQDQDAWAFKRKQSLDIEFLALNPSAKVAEFVILQMRPIYQTYADKPFANT